MGDDVAQPIVDLPTAMGDQAAQLAVQCAPELAALALAVLVVLLVLRVVRGMT